MGEYAKRVSDDAEVKIGTCENMYYLRADQVDLVRTVPTSFDLSARREVIRFRFPWPDEDGLAPGEFSDHDRSLAVDVDPGELPAFEHSSVQFKARAGYLVSLPCPESPEGAGHGLRVQRNGFGGNVRIVQQKFAADGRLMLVCDCGGCGARYRLPALTDAEPVIAAVRRLAQRADQSGLPAVIADRIEAGYLAAVAR